MFCKNCTLIVIILFYIAATGRAAEPDANADTNLANDATAAISKWSTLKWKMRESSPFARVESPAAVIKGKLYLFGGFTDDLQASNQIDIYDPTNDAWSRAKEMPTGVTHLNPESDGSTLWFAGGFKGHHPGPVTDVNSCHRFDPAMNQWSEIAKLPDGRSHFESSTIVYKGRILIVGGRCNSSQPPRNVVDNILEYDPQADQWHVVGTLPEKVLAPAAAIIGGHLIVTGGGLNNPRPIVATTRIAELPVEKSLHGENAPM